MIKAVAFDFDHTLYDRDKTLELIAPEFMSHFSDKLRDSVTLEQVVAATFAQVLLKVYLRRFALSRATV